MQQAAIAGNTIEFEVRGQGEPVLFVHGALIADAFEACIRQPTLGGHIRGITYRRRGYHGSTRPTSVLNVDDHARDAGALLRHLGIGRAHVVGHSYGGAVSMQLALDEPDLVQSLALLEPAIVTGPSRTGYLELMEEAKRRVETGDIEGTTHEFLSMRFGAGYRSWLEAKSPGAYASAVAHALTTFSYETSGLADWRFDAALASRVEQPVLLVLGSESPLLWVRFGETHELLRSWLPNTEEYILPGATHALQMQNPEDLADAIARFVRRHPIEPG